MSQELISRNIDLTRLQNEGYELEVRNSIALIHNVPYVNANSQICYGALISPLTLSGDITTRPDSHVIFFNGEYPCDKYGKPILAIQHSSQKQIHADGIESLHSFSNKPPAGYSDYYEKFTRYIDVISAPAQAIDNSVTACTFRLIGSMSDSVFEYYDTNTSRSFLHVVSKKLHNQKIGIIGLGGTGSYILDFVAKTPVSEIHLFDGDQFLQHNAFRAPGAASRDILTMKQMKVDYFHNVYKNMHKRIYPHGEYLNKENSDALKGLDFVFICVDGSAKISIIEALNSFHISFVDVGIGIELCDDSLIGSLRITACSPNKSEHLGKYISLAETKDDPYSSNIQISELNAFNAVLAVIKWKKMIGFYQDLHKEHHTVYTINTGEIDNEEYSS